VQALSTGLSQMIVARFGPEEDIFESLEALCREKNIESGSICTMIGSLESATLVCVTEDSPGGQAHYLDPVEIIGPLEFVGAQGIIGKNEEGELSIHLHGVVAGEDMHPLAGHIVDSGHNKVLATVEVVINVFSDVQMLRSFDEETRFTLFKVTSKNNK
jgi:predicted DNA-binding protein with PD1-like motif